MIGLANGLKVFVCTLPADMRRSFDGLSGMAVNIIEQDPLSGHLFVFINRKRTQMKVLYFDRSGYCVWSKRLEQGRFQVGSEKEDKMALDWTRLKLLLEGIDVRERKQYKRYMHPQTARAAV